MTNLRRTFDLLWGRSGSPLADAEAYWRYFEAGAKAQQMLAPDEPPCGHPWVEPETGRCLGCGNTVNREGKL